MLALHQKLKETNPANMYYVLTKLKPGDNDCLSYINKILVGTNQEATSLRRFADMTHIGAAIGFFVEHLSPFKPNILNEETNTKCNGL